MKSTSSLDLPSAPPSYEVFGDQNAYPYIHGQYNRRLSYGTVGVPGNGPIAPNMMTQSGYYSQYPTQPIFLQPRLVNNTFLQPICTEPLLGGESCAVFCIVCQKRIKTRTRSAYPCLAHACCFLMFLSGGLCLCSPLVYCYCQPKKITHSCPHCHSIIGIYYPHD